MPRPMRIRLAFYGVLLLLAAVLQSLSLAQAPSRVVYVAPIEGMIDLGIDTPGYHELTSEGILERNPLFRNFEADGTVTGYGMSRPGRRPKRK